MYTRILIPTDGSACSEEAIHHGLALAKSIGAAVCFLYVLDPLPPAMTAEAYSFATYAGQLLEDMRRLADTALAKAEALAREAGVPSTRQLIERTRPVDGILEAMSAYDLVVMGSHGRSGFRRLLLGSVAEGVMRQAVKPVLVVRCSESRQAS